ncbi:hypothetical protein POM88_027851 [Heracleum sosnowskyi]|uniref:Splicing factor cactin central domain-containing protein n=1 Tax=Heracleum sosnowskyi TaxID=360622 RepID=A0AAD8MQA9_9APIA|nr:hypothetical protein POM88_027851 [Heracleum sosnowskyi]
MEVKRTHLSSADAQILNENEYENEKQQGKKRKTTPDDMALKLAKRIKSRNANTKISHLLLEIEEQRREIERMEEIEKVKTREEKVTEKAEHEEKESVDDRRGLHSSAAADFKNLLQGKSHSELEVLRSAIESQMRSGSGNEVECCEVVLKFINMYKVKACLKDIQAKILRIKGSSAPLKGQFYT